MSATVIAFPETSAEPNLVCVDPQMVSRFWPHVRLMMIGAVQRVGLSHSAEIEKSVLTGRSLLWLAWNGNNIEAACITELMETDQDKICTVLACAGAVRGRWLHLLEEIERWAFNDEKCHAVRVYGREGWERVLPDYARIATVIEKRR